MTIKCLKKEALKQGKAVVFLASKEDAKAWLNTSNGSREHLLVDNRAKPVALGLENIEAALSNK